MHFLVEGHREAMGVSLPSLKSPRILHSVCPEVLAGHSAGLAKRGGFGPPPSVMLCVEFLTKQTEARLKGRKVEGGSGPIS